MNIKKIISQNRRDFSAIMICQFCNHEKKLNGGYDDAYYHQHVIPEMKCEKCNKSTISEKDVVINTKTKYPEHLQL